MSLNVLVVFAYSRLDTYIRHAGIFHTIVSAICDVNSVRRAHHTLIDHYVRCRETDGPAQLLANYDFAADLVKTSHELRASFHITFLDQRPDVSAAHNDIIYLVRLLHMYTETFFQPLMHQHFRSSRSLVSKTVIESAVRFSYPEFPDQYLIYESFRRHLQDLLGERYVEHIVHPHAFDDLRLFLRI